LLGPDVGEVEEVFDGGGDLFTVFVVEGELGVEVVGVGEFAAVVAGEGFPELPEAVDVAVEAVEDGVGGGDFEGAHVADVGPGVHGAVGAGFDGAHAAGAVVAEAVDAAGHDLGGDADADHLGPEEVGGLGAGEVGEGAGVAADEVLELDEARGRGADVAVGVPEGVGLGRARCCFGCPSSRRGGRSRRRR
jgi:hypothetical protein